MNGSLRARNRPNGASRANRDLTRALFKQWKRVVVEQVEEAAVEMLGDEIVHRHKRVVGASGQVLVRVGECDSARLADCGERISELIPQIVDEEHPAAIALLIGIG